jgi:hypothetical protein
MAIPTQKAPEIENVLSLFVDDRKRSITADECAWCRKPATQFKDDVSRREFRISGLCQACQDETFG